MRSQPHGALFPAGITSPVRSWRFPTDKLLTLFHGDATLELYIIRKLCEELRRAQRHAFVVARRDAVNKVAMFLRMLEELQADRGEPTNEIYLPMDRTEIGEYVGLSIKAVSRSFRTLFAAGIAKPRDRRHVKIIDRQAFDALMAVRRRPR